MIWSIWLGTDHPNFAAWRCLGRIQPSDARSESQARAGGEPPKTKSQDSSTSWPRTLRFQNRVQRRFRLSFKRLRDFHGRLNYLPETGRPSGGGAGLNEG